MPIPAGVFGIGRHACHWLVGAGQSLIPPPMGPVLHATPAYIARPPSDGLVHEAAHAEPEGPLFPVLLAITQQDWPFEQSLDLVHRTVHVFVQLLKSVGVHVLSARQQVRGETHGTSVQSSPRLPSLTVDPPVPVLPPVWTDPPELAVPPGPAEPPEPTAPPDPPPGSDVAVAPHPKRQALITKAAVESFIESDTGTGGSERVASSSPRRRALAKLLAHYLETGTTLRSVRRRAPRTASW
jgi:hypothetical protein